MAARFAKLNRCGADLENQLIDVRDSFNTHVNIMGETPPAYKKRDIWSKLDSGDFNSGWHM